MRWQIITGEYPPQLGGISDYTRLVARGLAAAGDAVDVWTSPCPDPAPTDPGVTVHRLPDRFGRGSRAALDAAIGALLPGDRRVLLQYEPFSFGWSGMNVPFFLHVWRRGRAWNLTVMFHEDAADIGWRLTFRQNVLGAVTHLNLGLAGRAAQRAFISIPAWESVLRPWVGRGKSIRPLPVPSNLTDTPDPGAVAARRADLLGRLNATQLLGHFGTFRGEVGSMLGDVLQRIGARPGLGIVLVGSGAEAFRRGLDPALAARSVVADSVSSEEAAEHLAACDALVQPYPDGVSARRSSTMAGLMLGAAVVTNAGRLSDASWAASGAVRLVPNADSGTLAEAVFELLDNPTEQGRLRKCACEYYAAEFSIERSINTLRESAAGRVPPQLRSS